MDQIKKNEERRIETRKSPEVNQRRGPRERIQQIVDNNKLFKMTAPALWLLCSPIAKFGSRIADGFKFFRSKEKKLLEGI